MKINFRQGVVKARGETQPDFLEHDPNDNTVTIDITDVPLTVAVAFRGKNYLIDQRETLSAAWGPLEWNYAWGDEQDVSAWYLYWDIDLASGEVTRGITPYEQIVSHTQPWPPKVDQHWYDKGENVMKVWDGTFWIPRARLFAGHFDGTMYHYPFGSQVGLYYPGTLSEKEEAGYILYGMDQKGIIDSSKTFVTTAQKLGTYHGSFTSSIRLELASSTFLAAESVPAFYCVSNNGDGTISLGKGTSFNFKPIGLAYHEAASGEAIDIVHQGILYNDLWDWRDVDTLGKNVFCGDTGELVQGFDIEGRVKVGTILDRQYVLVHIDEFGTGGGGAETLLEHDVEVIGTNVGAVSAGYVFPQGMTFTEFVDVISKKALPAAYSLSSNPSPGNVEVGTVLSISLSDAYSKGSNGAATARRLYRSGSLISSSIPYTDPNIEFTLASFSYQSQLDYAESSNPAGGIIPAGTLTSNTITFVGKRKSFFGTPGSTPTTSAGVRGLGDSSFNATNNADVNASGMNLGGSATPSFTITIPVGSARVVFAYPASSRQVASVRYQELADSEVKANFTETTVTVEGANGFDPVSYRVYTYVPVEPFSIENHYKVYI